MSFGIGVRNSIAIGISGLVSLSGGRQSELAQNNLLTESSDNLVQEDGGLIILE